MTESIYDRIKRQAAEINSEIAAQEDRDNFVELGVRGAVLVANQKLDGSGVEVKCHDLSEPSIGSVKSPKVLRIDLSRESLVHHPNIYAVIKVAKEHMKCDFWREGIMIGKPVEVALQRFNAGYAGALVETVLEYAVGKEKA